MIKYSKQCNLRYLKFKVFYFIGGKMAAYKKHLCAFRNEAECEEELEEEEGKTLEEAEDEYFND